jgi:hypothetical protein
MKTIELLNKIEATKVVTENEINLLKNRLNKGEVIDLSVIYNNEIEITSEQTEKGIAFLLNQWETPKGKERLNNPFGYREKETLETFERFYFVGFYDAGNSYIKQMLPIYLVCGKETTFEYYYNGKIQIIG